MEPAQQLRVIWDARRWVLLATLVAGLAAYFVSRSLTPTYRSTALVQIVSGAQASGNGIGPDALLQLTNIYEQQARGTLVIQQAGASLSPPQPLSSFKDHVDVAAEQQSGVLSFQGTAREPGAAARNANAYASAFVRYLQKTQDAQRRVELLAVASQVKTVRRQLAVASRGARDVLAAQLQALQARTAQEQLRARDTAQPLEEATVPTSAASPRPVRDAILVMLVALILASAAAYLRSNFSDRYRSADDAADDLRLPLLGIIPGGKPDSFAVVEAVRLVRTSIEFALKDGGHGNAPAGGASTVVMTSAEAGAGKTFTTANLAKAFAVGGRRVLAVDGDLRRPMLHRWFGVAREPGLSDALTAEDSSGDGTQEALVRVTRVASGGDLDLVTAGKPLKDDAEHLLTDRAHDVIGHLQRTHDLMLIDSPPLLAVADAAILGRYATGVILVIDGRGTRRRQARRALQTLWTTDAPVLGVIVNRAGKVDEVSEYSYGLKAEGLRSGMRRTRAS